MEYLNEDTYLSSDFAIQNSVIFLFMFDHPSIINSLHDGEYHCA